MNWDELISNLRLGHAEGAAAPHKPLLLLLMLRRASEGGANGVRFSEIERDLSPWIEEITKRSSADPRLPFWHLRSDFGGQAWRCVPDEGFKMQAGKDRPTKKSLREINPLGFLADDLWSEVESKPEAASRRANQLIETAVDPELRERVRLTVGLSKTGFGARGPRNSTQNREPWNDDENAALIQAYLGILVDELHGRPTNKAEVNRSLRGGPIQARSRGSIEMKMANVSSVLHEAGLCYVQGYKPRSNTQRGTFHAEVLRQAAERSIPTTSEALEPTSDFEVLENRARQLQARARVERPNGNPTPLRTASQASEAIIRDPKVVAFVLQESGGVCAACDQDAPFKGTDGRPYLEVHHIHPLAEGGPDTVENACALCPNCHRRLHYGDDRDEARARLIYDSPPG